jgi:hypothetical protein
MKDMVDSPLMFEKIFAKRRAYQKSLRVTGILQGGLYAEATTRPALPTIG